MEETLMMIKPDAVQRNLVGEILCRVEQGGLAIAGLRMVRLTAEQAREFYAVHQGKPFLESLVAFMSSGPIVAVRVEGDGAIQRLAEIVGSTDPAKAAPGTIRRDFGLGIEKNSVHRSDAPETARAEIRFFGFDLSLR
ncbi:MAG: nucleoside-diphosphate kinase [Candidatus Eisenbacteria bacterium]|nr:nucleoside-diphosphate kinase [Candidatus Eisenbacteria bacterium]